MKRPELPRVVHFGDDGDDAYGHKVGMHRYLKDGLLDELESKPLRVRRHAGGTPGEGWGVLLHAAQRKAQQPVRDEFDDRLYKVLWAADGYDARATNLVIRYALKHPKLGLVFPFPSNVNARLCQGLHETGGLPGNWALDWCAPPGSPVVAVEKATVYRLSGSDPATDRPDNIGAFGFTTYYITPAGIKWFWTHFGKRALGLKVGQGLEPGEPVGYVGDQEFRPDHTHGGASHPLGEAAAKKHVTAVNKAPRVTL